MNPPIERLTEACADVTVEHRTFVASDGTEIPISVIRYSDNAKPGPQPTVLHAYAAYGMSTPLTFRPLLAAWLESGGVAAIVHSRGGGERGNDWHRAGQGVNRVNARSDVADAARWLEAEDITTPEMLAAWGRSAGSRLVSSAAIEFPELFSAVIAEVGPSSIVGSQSEFEYGSPDDPDQARASVRDSPRHNVQPGVSYPAFFLTALANDKRVGARHAFQLCAELQHATKGEKPVLLRYDQTGGHFGPASPGGDLDELAEMLAFLGANLGLRLEVNPLIVQRSGLER